MYQQYSLIDCPEPWRSGEVYAYAEQLHALPAEQKRHCARPKGTYSGSDVPRLYQDGAPLGFPLFSEYYIGHNVFVFFFFSCCSGFHCWCILYPKLFWDHSNLAIANENSSEGWSWWARLRSPFDATGADLIFHDDIRYWSQTQPAILFQSWASNPACLMKRLQGCDLSLESQLL